MDTTVGTPVAVSQMNFRRRRASPLDGAVVRSGHVVSQEFPNCDGHPHRVGPLGFHDVRAGADQVLSHTDVSTGHEEVVHIPSAFSRR